MYLCGAARTVSANFTSKQILSLGFAEQGYIMQDEGFTCLPAHCLENGQLTTSSVIWWYDIKHINIIHAPTKALIITCLADD